MGKNRNLHNWLIEDRILVRPFKETNKQRRWCTLISIGPVWKSLSPTAKQKLSLRQIIMFNHSSQIKQAGKGLNGSNGFLL